MANSSVLDNNSTDSLKILCHDEIQRRQPQRRYHHNRQKGLLPKVIALYPVRSQGQNEILAVGGHIKVDDFWTIEALVDQLVYHVIQVRDQPQQQNLQPSSFSDRKYLNHVIAIISSWSKVDQNHQRHQFIFNLSDILINDGGGRLAAELVDLSYTTRSTLAYVLHAVVARIFTAVSSSWFYESAAEEIQVVLEA